MSLMMAWNEYNNKLKGKNVKCTVLEQRQNISTTSGDLIIWRWLRKQQFALLISVKQEDMRSDVLCKYVKMAMCDSNLAD